MDIVEEEVEVKKTNLFA